MRGQWSQMALGIACVAAIVWAYWTTLGDIADRWASDPQYSHGYLVPAFAVVLLWHRRSRFPQASAAARRIGWLWLALLGAGMAVRAASVKIFLGWLDGLSLIICLTGVVAAAGGWSLLRWAWPAIVFLIFMIPLPFRVQNALGSSLQSIATQASTYALQTVGVPAVAEGNIILLTETRIGVVEACSGLGMLMTFAAMATGVAMWVPRSWLEKSLIILSAIPVAVAVNVVRITVTGVLNEASQDRLARIVFHDVAGWLMMPLALAILFFELHVLGRAIVARPGSRLERSGFVGSTL